MVLFLLEQMSERIFAFVLVKTIVEAAVLVPHVAERLVLCF